MLAISGALYWATRTKTVEVDESEEEEKLIQKELDKLEFTAKEVEAINARYGDIEKLLLLLSESLGDRELRKDFFAFLRLTVISLWIDAYKENGRFIHPEDQEGEWLNPLEWAQLPEFYDVAIQPRLSSDSLDLAFILRLKERYKGLECMPLFGGILSMYLMIFATLETRAGRDIYHEYGGMPDLQDPAYYKIRDRVNRRLGLQKSFKEILAVIDGDAFDRIDRLASYLQSQ
jgi:hypothetical protein